MSESAGTGNTAPGLTSVAALLFIWALLTYIVRAWVKLRKSDSWGIDDTTISISLLFAFFHVVATCYAVSHGYGNSWSDLSQNDNVEVKKVQTTFCAFLKILYTLGSLTISVSLCRSDPLRSLHRPHQSLHQLVQHPTHPRHHESAHLIRCYWSLCIMDRCFHLDPLDTR